MREMMRWKRSRNLPREFIKPLSRLTRHEEEVTRESEADKGR